MRKLFAVLLMALMLGVCLISALAESENAPLADGIYLADFNTDSSMFRLNETTEGKGVLTVKDGVMTIHITLLSKNFLKAYAGPAEEAKLDGAILIDPTKDEVTYSDGFKDTVYGFDIPVPAIGEDFVISVVGKKGKWYSHTVSVTNPEPLAD